MRLLLRRPLLVGTIAILLLVAEGICRLRIHQTNQSTLQSALENPPPPSENATKR